MSRESKIHSIVRLDVWLGIMGPQKGVRMGSPGGPQGSRSWVRGSESGAGATKPGPAALVPAIGAEYLTLGRQESLAIPAWRGGFHALGSCLSPSPQMGEIRVFEWSKSGNLIPQISGLVHFGHFGPFWEGPHQSGVRTPCLPKGLVTQMTEEIPNPWKNGEAGAFFRP